MLPRFVQIPTSIDVNKFHRILKANHSVIGNCIYAVTIENCEHNLPENQYSLLKNKIVLRRIFMWQGKTFYKLCNFGIKKNFK